MKTVLVVLLILAAGAGAWFSGLSGLFGINGQYQDFKEMISYRKTLDKEIRTWTSLRNDMIKNRGLADEKNKSLERERGSVERQLREQQDKEAELKEEEVQLNADLSKINKLIEDICRNGNEGLGKPEALSGNLAGYWSRRIKDRDR